MIFSWRPDVCACVRVYPIFNVSKPDNSWMAWDIDMKFGNQWNSLNPLIVTIFKTIDARFVILWDFEFCEKRAW